jgi:addiction module HigA family antidote
MARMHNPAHPGEVLREFLPEEMTIGEVAARLRVSRPHLSRLLNGRSAMTAEMAIRVGMLTRTTPESWLANQVKWELWQALHKERVVVEPLPMSKAS